MTADQDLSLAHHFADLTDKTSIDHLVKDHLVPAADKPYIFHLGAQAHVGESWHRPYETVMANTVGTLNLLQSIVDHDVELGALDRGVVEQALVVNLDDIAALAADDTGHPRQRARHIGQLAAQPHKPAAAHQPAHQQRGEEARVDVASGHDDANATAAKPRRIGEQGRDPGGAGALDDKALAFDQ